MSSLGARRVSVLRGARQTLRGVDFEVNHGELVGLIGPNGSGKTTLMRCLVGLQTCTSGEVVYGGRALHEYKRSELARHLGYLPQNANFYWPLSVKSAVHLGRHAHPSPRFNRAEDEALVRRAMRDTGVLKFANRSVDTLSGGEQMRVHLARLLAGQVNVIVADEPITSLDIRFQLSILGSLKTLAASGTAVVVSLHDLSLAARFCDRLVVLSEGRIVADGPAESVLAGPVLGSAFGVCLEHVDSAHGSLIVADLRESSTAQ